MTRQETIAKFYRDRAKEEPVAESKAGHIRFAFLIGAIVRMKLGDDLRGFICKLEVVDSSVLYTVSWGDRSCSAHFGFELIADEDADDVASNA